jgi:hypothetical protein
VKEATWAAGESKWIDALSRDADTEEKKLVRMFGARFVESSEALARDQPALDSLSQLPPSPTPPADLRDVDATAFLDVVIFDEPLPFTDEPSPEFVQALGRGVEASIDDAGMTGFITGLNFDDDPLPFGDNKKAELTEQLESRLTLEQYASLCAELTCRPHDRRATLERYGIGEHVEALNEVWATRFERAPADKLRWEQLTAQYRAWLERGQR